MKKNTYNIEIINWTKHNGSKKKNHRYFLLENRFFEDSKISQLKPIESVLFVKLLCIAGDLMSSSFEVHSKMVPSSWRIDDKLMENCLKTLQSFQLLRYEKKESLYNRKEEKRKEENRKEVTSPQKIESPPLKNLDLFDKEKNIVEKTIGSKIWDAYSESYRLRYKTDPLRDKQTNSICKRIGERLGEIGPEIASFYLTHNKPFYISTLHSLKFLLNDAEALHTQYATGKKITSADVKRIEKAEVMSEMIQTAKERNF